MEPTIWRFLLFLGSELVFLIASFIAAALIGFLIIKNNAIKNSYVVSGALMFEVVTPLFLFLFLWILTGANYLPLFAVLAAVSIVLILASEFAWLVIGTRNIPWGAQLVWSQYEFQQSVPTLHKSLQIIGTVAIMIAYPAYIGYGYFGDAFANGDWPRYVMRATLVLLVGVAWATFLPVRLYLMASRNIAEDVRSRLFISQLGQSVSVLLLIALFIWAVDVNGPTATLVGNYFVFSPTVAYVVGGYLVVALVIPYLVGHYRAKRWADQLAAERHDIIAKLVKGLLSPNLARVGDALEEAKREIQAARARLNEDSVLELADRIGNSRVSTDIVHQLALRDAQKRDPRFTHAADLASLAQVVDDCAAQLAQKNTEKKKREVADAYVKLLDKEKESHGGKNEGAKPIVLVGLATLAGSVLNPIVSSVGKFVSDFVFGP